MGLYEPASGKVDPMTVRIIRHEAVPQTGSFEVRFSDGRPSVYIYWDGIAERRISADEIDSKGSLEAAKAIARAEQDEGH
jgi:hypothetical protein